MSTTEAATPSRRRVGFKYGKRYERPYTAELEGGEDIERNHNWSAKLYLIDESLTGYDKMAVVVLENGLEADCQIQGTIPPITPYYLLTGENAAHEPRDDD